MTRSRTAYQYDRCEQDDRIPLYLPGFLLPRLGVISSSKLLVLLSAHSQLRDREL
jgi:hypothetical protein